MNNSFLVVIAFFASILFAESKIERIIFNERQIEGKIRRPQLVLIKAEQRPNFNPMIIQTLDNNMDIEGLINCSAIERSPYQGAFLFEGTKIANFVY